MKKAFKQHLVTFVFESLFVYTVLRKMEYLRKDTLPTGPCFHVLHETCLSDSLTRKSRQQRCSNGHDTTDRRVRRQLGTVHVDHHQFLASRSWEIVQRRRAPRRVKLRRRIDRRRKHQNSRRRGQEELLQAFARPVFRNQVGSSSILLLWGGGVLFPTPRGRRRR